MLEELKKLSSDRKEDSEDSRKVSERREEQEGNFKGSERKYSYTSCFDKETLDSTFKKKKLVSN